MKILEQGYRPTNKLDRSKPPQGGSAIAKPRVAEPPIKIRKFKVKINFV